MASPLEQFVRDLLAELWRREFHIEGILKAILESEKNRARIALRERVLHREKIKSFNKPLHLVPHSLHPIESVAH